MSDDIFRRGQVIKAGTLNRRLREVGAVAGEAAAAPYATAAAASATAADASATAAAASEASALSAASSAFGLILLSSVAGTTDGNGECSAYTATAPTGLTPVEGRNYLFVPHANSSGTATLAINGTTARSIRRADTNGVLFRRQQLKADRLYLLSVRLVSTTPVFTAHDVIGSEDWFGNRAFVGPGPFRIEMRQEGDTEYRIALSFRADGGVDILGNGDGTTTPDVLARFLGDAGDSRIYGRLLNEFGVEFYHPSNPPTIDFDDVEEISESNQGPAHENAVTPLIASDAYPVPLTGADLNREGWAASTGCWFDAEPMRIHTSMRVGVKSSIVANFYTGRSTNFLGRTSNVVQITGPAYVWVKKFQGQDELLIGAHSGTLSDVAAPSIPVYARTWIGGGQSWMARAIWHGLSGARETYQALSMDPSIRSIAGAAGASALLIGAPTNPDNYWWDHLMGLPGPNAENMRDVIYAWLTANPTQPFPEAVLWCYGLNDLGSDLTVNFAPTGNNTPAAWTQAQIDMQAWLDAELSTLTGTTVELNHFITPLPARKLGVFDEEKWYAMRRCQLDVVATAPRTYRGADCYDLLRMWNDEHHSFAMQKRWGARWPYFVENALHSGTNYLGPKITGFTEVSTSEYWVRIERGEVSPGVDASLVRPANPAGFGLIPAGTHFFEERVAVSRYSWTTDSGDDILVIRPRTAETGLRLCYPYGSAYESQEPSRLVRDARTLLPLQTYHPSV